MVHRQYVARSTLWNSSMVEHYCLARLLGTEVDEWTIIVTRVEYTRTLGHLKGTLEAEAHCRRSYGPSAHQG